MANPNNCATCDHKRNPQGGWCYMFRDEPQASCAKHSTRIGHDCALQRGSIMCRQCDLDVVARYGNIAERAEAGLDAGWWNAGRAK